MELKTWNFDLETLITEFNKVKDAVIGSLIDEGDIKGNFDDIASTYIVVVKTKGMFGKWWDKFMNHEETVGSILLLKSLAKPLGKPPKKEKKETVDKKNK